jgi:putative ABC transport system ATP-binding protein
MNQRNQSSGLPLSCKDIRHVYEMEGSEVVALSGVDLHVEAGASVAILGPSGSGKSTLLSLMAGLLRPTAGQLLVGTADLGRMPERALIALRGRELGVVVQNPSRNLLRYATPEGNLRFAQRAVARSRRPQLPAPQTLLRDLGLARLGERPVARLSGGEQQRLALAVAMATSPGLLLVDEPTSQLDDESRGLVIALLTQIGQRFGSTVIAVTHDPVVAESMDRSVTISGGVMRP